eukprot:Rmarinus@m.29978
MGVGYRFRFRFNLEKVVVGFECSPARPPICQVMLRYGNKAPVVSEPGPMKFSVLSPDAGDRLGKGQLEGRCDIIDTLVVSAQSSSKDSLDPPFCLVSMLFSLGENEPGRIVAHSKLNLMPVLVRREAGKFRVNLAPSMTSAGILYASVEGIASFEDVGESRSSRTLSWRGPPNGMKMGLLKHDSLRATSGKHSSSGNQGPQPSFSKPPLPPASLQRTSPTNASQDAQEGPALAVPVACRQPADGILGDEPQADRRSRRESRGKSWSKWRSSMTASGVPHTPSSGSNPPELGAPSPPAPSSPTSPSKRESQKLSPGYSGSGVGPKSPRAIAMSQLEINACRTSGSASPPPPSSPRSVDARRALEGKEAPVVSSLVLVGSDHHVDTKDEMFMPAPVGLNRRNTPSQSSPSAEAKVVLVVGGGSVQGQHAIRYLLAGGFAVRVLATRQAKWPSMLTGIQPSRFDPKTVSRMGLPETVTKGVFAIMCFPDEALSRSMRYCSLVRMLAVMAADSDVRRFVLTSSTSIARPSDSLKHQWMNWFEGTSMTWRLKGEQALKMACAASSSLTFTIIRHGTLVNRVFESPGDEHHAAVELQQGHCRWRDGCISYDALARVCVGSLPFDVTRNTLFDVFQNGPASQAVGWKKLFDELRTSLIPTREWMLDSEASKCCSCEQPFHLLRRRHHCRHCGRLFCWDCCNTRMPLPHLNYAHPVLICLTCALRNMMSR